MEIPPKNWQSIISHLRYRYHVYKLYLFPACEPESVMCSGSGFAEFGLQNIHGMSSSIGQEIKPLIWTFKLPGQI